MEAARDLTARAPLLLQEPGAAWRVARGRVDLFAVELVAGDPRGRRHGLATLSPGDPLFGVAAPASGVALVAVAMGEARVEPIDLAALGATECARIAERWVALLAAALPMDGGRAQTLLRAGALADVEPGTTVAALRDPAWIADAGAVELGGRPLAGALPVAGGLVLRARAAGTLEPLEGAAAIAAAAAWQDGLEALGQAVLAQLGERIAAGAEHHRTRIERRAEAGRAETEGTYSALRQVVERRGLAVAPGTDPVAVACRIAGLSQGLRVAEPARGHEEPVAARLRAVARASGFRAREVQLDEGWWRRDVGNLVGVAEDERPVALVRRRGRYELADPVQGTQAPLDRGSAALLAPTAFMLYAGLEPEPATGRRVIGLGLRPARADLARLLATSLILGLLSIATPVAAGAIFTTIVPEGARGELLWIALVLAGVAVGTAVASLAQGLALLRVEAKASTGIQAAVIDRLLALPASFFRRYSAGDLGSRALAVDTIRQSLTTSVVAGLMALLVALFNVLFILTIDVGLGLLSIGLLLAAVVVLWGLARLQVPHQRRLQAALGRSQALGLQILGAVPKLRVAGAEDRAFARWAASLGRMKEAFVDTQRAFAALSAFTAAWQALAIALVLLVVGEARDADLPPGEFVAFTTAFGATAGAILGLGSLLTVASQTLVLWERARPIVREPPEVSRGSGDPGELHGAVELANVTFRYGDEGPPVLADVSFAAAPGEFVAIVGPSGAGKSTVLRLLLGFEQPETGTISYDEQSLDDLDPGAVRRQLGVVIQNARVLAGSIFQNIVGASKLTLDDAWAAARIAGIAEDIERMPMGMHTFVSDAAAAFSGGQRQRLLIARAVVARPRILLFDEATSALDNRTQAAVSAALEKLQATRIVIAHRLSTIRTADRIVVLERGRVVEQGSYDELIEGAGLFTELARRQIA